MWGGVVGGVAGEFKLMEWVVRTLLLMSEETSSFALQYSAACRFPLCNIFPRKMLHMVFECAVKKRGLESDYENLHT